MLLCTNLVCNVGEEMTLPIVQQFLPFQEIGSGNFIYYVVHFFIFYYN